MSVIIYRVDLGDDLPHPETFLPTRELALAFGQAWADFVRQEVAVATVRTVVDTASPEGLAAMMEMAPGTYIEDDVMFLLPSEHRRLNTEPGVFYGAGGPEVVIDIHERTSRHLDEKTGAHATH